MFFVDIYKKTVERITLAYSRMKIRSKLMLYFTLFGLAIGYFSFLFNVAVATYEFKNFTSHLISEWSRNNTAPPDAIESLAGKKYNMEMVTLLPFIALSGKGERQEHGNRELNLYVKNTGTDTWFSLYPDNEGIICRKVVSDPEEIDYMNRALKKPVNMKNILYWGRADRYHLWINLTRPLDQNFYLAEFVIGRNGLIHSLGGIYVIFFYSMAIMAISFLLSKGLSYYISKPIKKLSLQALAISKGDFNTSIEIMSKDEIGVLSSSINTMTDEIRHKIDEINERMNAISLMNKIDKAVLSSVSRNSLIDNVTAIVSELFPDCSVFLAVADFEKNGYSLLSRFIRGERTMPSEEFFIRFEEIGMDVVRRNMEFYVVSNDNESEFLERYNSLFNERHMHIMNLPIYMDDDYTGSLVIGKYGHLPFSPFERDASKALADQTGVAMKSVRYVEEREKLFLGVLLALSKTIDAKSRWTSGHSERVADYSKKIAMRMGLEPEFINNLSVSANLHDIGKIGVPESILDKEGELTEDEFEIIKKHPQGGGEIIEVIPGYEKLINGIIFHHEHWDGCGYPFGLEKERIPLMGRIIAVADVYDSLISDRPYRSGMVRERAIEILRFEKGRKLDPEIVDIMIEIIESESF